MIDNFDGNKKAFGAFSLAAISTLLPWLGAGAMGFVTTFNGLNTGAGYLAIISSIAGLYLVWKENELCYIPGIVNLVIGIGCKLNILNLGSVSMQGVSVNAPIALGIQYGLVLFLIASALAVFWTYKKS